MYAARRLIDIVADIRCRDRDIQLRPENSQIAAAREFVESLPFTLTQ